MPRPKAADAALKTAKNRELVAEASKALGHPVTVRQAQQWAREQRTGGGPGMGDKRTEMPQYRVVDRQLDVPAEHLRSLGKVLARVQDLKFLKGGTVSLSLSSHIDFGHLLTDAAALSGSPLVIEISEYMPPSAEWDELDDDADKDEDAA